MDKHIIIYYSWQGSTEVIANQLQEVTGYPIEKIIETKAEKRKFTNALFGAMFGLKSKIKPFDKDINDYNTIWFGTPVWTFKFPPATNRFLKQAQFKDKKVYAFISKGLDNEPLWALDKLRKVIEKKGGKLVDVMYTKTDWKPEDPVLP
jgi:flavodoxin